MFDLLIAIVAFFGLISSIFLRKIAKEEVKKGEKPLEIIEKVILFLLVIVLLYGTWKSYWVILSFVLGFFVLGNVYFFLGLGLFSSSFNFLIALLIFIYGLFFGALKIKKIEDACPYLFWFLMAFILFFWEGFVVNYDYLFLSFAAGALFRKIFK